LPSQMYAAIAQYELHLRLYVRALESIGFMYPYHTVGSSMAVTAESYCRVGGMNKRQAGEDFYFLQKLFQSERTGIIADTVIIPSSRVSHRVPFGTGHAMATLAKSETKTFYSYCPESYEVLRQFIQPHIYRELSQIELTEKYAAFHPSLQEFMSEHDFISKIQEIKQHTSNANMFEKRFFTWINAFFIFRFLNTAHNSYFQKNPIKDAAQIFLNYSNTATVTDMLQFLRIEQKQTREC